MDRTGLSLINMDQDEDDDDDNLNDNVDNGDD